jgi:hypothetical protein
MSLAGASAKWTTARFANQRLLAKAALDHPHQLIHKGVHWKDIVYDFARIRRMAEGETSPASVGCLTFGFCT